MYAIDLETGEKIAPSPNIHKSKTLVCPYCNEAVIARCGDINQWHWAHPSDSTCPNRNPETQWHLGWKSLFDKEEVEVALPIWPNNRADVCFSNDDGQSYTVLEFQHSSIDVSTIAEREAAYGIDSLIWIVDVSEKTTFFPRPQHNDFIWERKQKSWMSATAPVVFDDGDSLYLWLPFDKQSVIDDEYLYDHYEFFTTIPFSDFRKRYRPLSTDAYWSHFRNGHHSPCVTFNRPTTSVEAKQLSKSIRDINQDCIAFKAKIDAYTERVNAAFAEALDVRQQEILEATNSLDALRVQEKQQRDVVVEETRSLQREMSAELQEIYQLQRQEIEAASSPSTDTQQQVIDLCEAIENEQVILDAAIKTHATESVALNSLLKDYETYEVWTPKPAHWLLLSDGAAAGKPILQLAIREAKLRLEPFTTAITSSQERLRSLNDQLDALLGSKEHQLTLLKQQHSKMLTEWNALQEERIQHMQRRSHNSIQHKDTLARIQTLEHHLATLHQTALAVDESRL